LNESCIEVGIGKNLSHPFSTQNDLKKGDNLSPLLFNFYLEYTISKVQEIEEGLESNGKHQLLISVYNINIFSENLNAIKKKHRRSFRGW